MFFVVFYFFVGMKKGFVSMFFSLFSVVIALFVSLMLCGKLAGVFENLFGAPIHRFLLSTINEVVRGKFSNKDQLLAALIPTKIGKFFGIVIDPLLRGVDFDGEMTAGAILAPSLTNLILKVISFVVLFVFFVLIFKLTERILKIVVKWLKIDFENRFFGGIAGVLKGMMVFFAFYIAINSIANFTFSEKLLDFARSGRFCQRIYNVYITKIISLFF